MNFYKQMMGSFTDRIILPEKLIQTFLPLVGNAIKLIRPSGAMWQVGLIRSGEMLVFEPGWKDFVCANDVLPDDLLVFKYVGGSAFEVSIFDPWGCEKSDSIEETTRVASILRDKSNMSKPDGYVEKSQDMVEGRECSVIAKSSENLTSCRKQSDLTSRKRKASGGNIYCEQHGLAMSDNMEVVCNSTSIDFSSMHFCKQMSSLSMHNMSLPVKVRMKLKGIVGKKLQLKRPSGDTWHISLIWSGEELVLQSGWNQFIVANNVSQNDLLVFRFIGGSKFEVLIFDPNGYEKNSNKEVRSCWQFFAYGAEPIRSRPENDGEISREIEVYGNATKCAEGRRTANEIGVHFPGDEQLAYDRVQGRNPSFLQVLKRSSLTIQCGISIPKKFSADYLPKECQDLVLCCPEKNKTWSVRYFYSQHQQFIRYAGWGKFVNENNLREGDVCLFELIKTLQPITFVVQVSRAS